MPPPPARRRSPRPAPAGRTVRAQLAAIERAGGDGELVFDDGATLAVSNLDKPFFPEVGLTKGGLMRYHVRVAPALLPAIDGRPLALKRFPNGVHGHGFFQHDPGASPPPGVRVARVPLEHGGQEPRYVGGDLRTLLHTVQLGTVAVNAWHSRVGALDEADYCVLDLDPGPEAPFSRVVRVALAVHAELRARGLRAALKTSGSRGLHILLPLPPGTTYARSAALAAAIAGRVAEALPDEATVERAIGARGPGRVYVDHMQNARGKTLASVFAVRARPAATVSAPVAWPRLARPGFDPGAYTAATVPGQLARLARQWAAAMAAVNGAQAIEEAVDGGG